ncbi:uncharacterized protein EI97DRAFT_464812 [Westerdykella ornata]|uniref:DUF788-domain-containing protein n=1 Tax=Westerdykella ornata TaxID=318751 RepID=A0A6A6JX00_WESOR|nr:uncharacterized protein EI97DRAFT_464812 [Westerdykella ornata]KAF2279589.1 hypothetical protein EI97DRAFT_464812 [Westerdykella ornata]
MAQKAAKTLAARNTSRLNQTLAATLLIHGFFLLLRALVFRSSFTRKSLVLYLLFSAPQWFINLQFERLGRPKVNPDGSIRRSGEDLEAKGLTEYMWDVTYWTYGCVFFAATVGDRAWWLWGIIPLYSVYLAYTTFMGVRQGYTDAAGVPQPQAATSKRQQKLEKRGGQKISYR